MCDLRVNLVESSKIIDFNIVSNILQQLNIALNSVSCVRIGAIDKVTGKNRPLRVKFSNKIDADIFIKNKHLHPQGTFITYDRTKQQRECYNRLRYKMVNHNKANPRSKKMIKFIDGEPTLVDTDISFNHNLNQEIISGQTITHDSNNQGSSRPIIKDIKEVERDRFNTAINNQRHIFYNKNKKFYSNTTLPKHNNSNSLNSFTNSDNFNAINSNNNYNYNNNKSQYFNKEAYIPDNTDYHSSNSQDILQPPNNMVYTKRKRGRPSNNNNNKCSKNSNGASKKKKMD